MRIVLFTGKGGVGKTTVASATALRIAAGGRKTLIMSTDPAHSLGDAFDTELGPEPSEVAPNLWAEEIDPHRRLEENWRDIQRHAIAVLNWAGLDEIQAEELSIIPGLDELFSLADVKSHHDESPYDVLIVDCAPTGETLRLLSLPDIIQWYMDRVFPSGTTSDGRVEARGATSDQLSLARSAGVRRGGALLREARRRSQGADGSRHHIRQAGGQSRAHGDSRGDENVHLSKPVRISRGLGDRQPATSV